MRGRKGKPKRWKQSLDKHHSLRIPFGDHPFNIGTIQRISAWPLRKDDANKSRSVNNVRRAHKGNGIGARGSKNPRAYLNPCFSLLGMVLRTRVWF